MNIAKLQGNGFLGVFARQHKNDDLVRLFRNEYKSEYEYARKSGAEINSKYVREFLNNR